MICLVRVAQFHKRLLNYSKRLYSVKYVELIIFTAFLALWMWHGAPLMWLVESEIKSGSSRYRDIKRQKPLNSPFFVLVTHAGGRCQEQSEQAGSRQSVIMMSYKFSRRDWGKRPQAFHQLCLPSSASHFTVLKLIREYLNGNITPVRTVETIMELATATI